MIIDVHTHINKYHMHIDDLAVDYPDLKIVICHIGNPWIKDCMEVVNKNKNV